MCAEKDVFESMKYIDGNDVVVADDGRIIKIKGIEDPQLL